MKKLSKRTRISQSAFSVERYTTCLEAAQNYCNSQCPSANAYAMGLVRDDRYSHYKNGG